MKKDQNKMIKAAPNKAAETSELPKALKCLQECVAPGIGYWKPGDLVTDRETIAYLRSNPNFEATKEAQQ